MNKPLLVFGDDNGFCSLYNLTLDQYNSIIESDDDPSQTLRKFEIKITESECGYVPDYVVQLSKIYGFDVESN